MMAPRSTGRSGAASSATTAKAAGSISVRRASGALVVRRPALVLASAARADASSFACSGGEALVLPSLLQRAQDRIALHLADRRDGAARRGRRRRRTAQHVVGQVLGADEAAAADHHGALDHVAQLAHVARPVIALQLLLD